MKENDIIELFLQNRLSEYKKHKVFNILGIKFKIQPRCTKHDTDILKLMLARIQKKLAMVDNISRIGNIKFYVPNYPIDSIQKTIVESGKFFEQDELELIKKYLPADDAVIFDVGANIGNHSIYWAIYCNAKKVYSFEPIDTTFNILKKNIELNNLSNVIIPYNIGLSDKKCNGLVTNYIDSNIGGTKIEQTNNTSGIKLERLDDINIEEEKIDFIKIDVEGHEYYALKGMENTLKKYKPTIFIEIFSENFNKVKALLKEYKYEEIEALNDDNYIFQYKES